MSSPEDIEVRSLIDSAFGRMSVAEFDKLSDERIVFNNFDTLINLLDFRKIGVAKDDLWESKMYVDATNGAILAIDACHTMSPEAVNIDCTQELVLWVTSHGSRPRFDFAVPNGVSLSERSKVNLLETVDRCSRLDPPELTS